MLEKLNSLVASLMSNPDSEKTFVGTCDVVVDKRRRHKTHSKCDHPIISGLEPDLYLDLFGLDKNKCESNSNLPCRAESCVECRSIQALAPSLINLPDLAMPLSLSSYSPRPGMSIG